jgi:cation transport ATPase
MMAAARRGLSQGRGGLRLAASRVGLWLVPLVFLAALAAVAAAALSGGDAHSAAMRVISAAIALSPPVFAVFCPTADTLGFAALARSGIFPDVRAARAIAAARSVEIDKSARIDADGEPREGLARTEETLRAMGYALTAPADVRVVSARGDAGREGDAAGVVRVAIGRAAEMDISGADVFLTQDKIAHLLKAVYICARLRDNHRRAFAVLAVYAAVSATLAALGIASPVYAGIASAVCALGLIVNNGRLEKRCRAITFERLLRP